MTEPSNQQIKTIFTELLPEIPQVCNSIKIKQEKLTPLTSPSHSSSTSAITNSVSMKQDNGSVDDNHSVSENTLSESVFASVTSNEDKKSVQLTKSSEELLAELFQAFNSAPPSALQTEETKSSKKAKKKHKKDKKKKHKKKGRSSSDDDNVDEPEKIEKKAKLKKVKKEKKDSKVLQVKDIKIEKDKSKKRKLSDNQPVNKHKKKKEDKEEQRQDDLDIDKYERELLEKVRREESSKSDSKTKSKIVIKSLKNSAVYEESMRQAEEKQKEKERKYVDGELSDTDQSKSSEISLSDEETYERNRSRFYERESYYGTRARDDRKTSHRERSPRNRSRDRYETSYYEHGYRGLESRYDDRDRERRRRRTRSRSHRRDNSEDRIDKKRLLEIARKNAISMLKNGTLPGTQNMAPEAKEKVLAKMRFGGKSVDELTEFCKKLSNGESSGYLSDVSDDSEHDEDGNERPFNHPFMLKDREPIVMNIKNATPIPPKTAEQTKAILMQFPVSSGTHHRLNESEWVPVPPTKKPAATPKASTKVEKPGKNAIPAIMPAPPSPSVPEPVPEPVPLPDTNIFPDANTGSDLDVTSIITKRLNAMRKLQDNPLDQEAIKLMYNTQKDMSAWANSKFIPGQFTGSTGANILSARELTSGFQAWAKRDQLLTTTPVSGGMGMHLLQKMGWRPGEGLGKEKNGSLQPLLLEVKLDKKGLVANEDTSGGNGQQIKRKKPLNVAQAQQNLESKHPVSLLGELSAKRKWQMPKYDLVCEAGPHHNRQFVFTVEMNGMVYRPPTASNNKKEAKAVAAKFALQQMGVLQ